MRLQRALEAATSFGIVTLLTASILLFLTKADLLSLRGLWIGLGAAVALPLLAALVAAARRVPAARVAKRIDTTHELHDRIVTSVEFAGEQQPSAFMLAHIEETRGHLDGVSGRRAAPLRRPRDLLPLGLLALCVVAVLLVRFPVDVRAPVVRPQLPKLTIDADDLEPHRAMAEQLGREALADGQEEMKQLADQLNKLFDQIENKELTRKELFAKLAELENKYMEGFEGSFDDMLKKLKKMGGDLRKEKLTEEAGKALQQANLNKAKQDLEKLADQLDKLSKRDQRRLARKLKQASRHELRDDRKLQRKARQLQRHIRRLKRKLSKQSQNQQLKRRLKRKRRQLQRLNKRQQRSAQRRRQLQRLNKQMRQAAQQLAQNLSPEARKALQKLAQQMGKFANQINKMRMRGKAQGQLADLKQLLRRLGKGGKGKKGRLKDFLARAGGKQGKNKCPKGKKCKKGLLLGKGDGKGGKLIVPLPGTGQGQQNGPGTPTGQPADGIGNSSDPNLKGDRTDLRGRRRNVMVRGQQGKGPTRSEVILGAADKGFSTTQYRRVYKDYSQIIEEVLEREDVPLGYKYYVKRYFQLIKPR